MGCSCMRGKSSVVLIGLSTLLLGLVPAGSVSGEETPLPLGDPDLTETRTTEVLADGVSLTRITRGAEPAREKDIGTTSRGPWRVNVLTIDPTVATGVLRAAYGPDLARTEPVTELAAYSGALAGINASYFTFTADKTYPGNPVGLGLYDGNLLSEPDRQSPAEVAMLIDSRTDQVVMDKLTWRGRILNQQTNAGIRLTYLNRPPVVPEGCRDKTTNPFKCKGEGDVVHLTNSFSLGTPEGRGVEIVLGRRGCVVHREKVRGTVLTSHQSSVQATGRKAVRLWHITEKTDKQACLAPRYRLLDSAGRQIETGPWLSGVNGRFRLTLRGRDVAPTGSGAFFNRHPRTIAGRTSSGAIVLVTIDGRQTTSVGATLKEAAGVALALGMRNAINLDGGGSTTMVANGALVNTPSGSSERAVGDALVYVPSP